MMSYQNFTANIIITENLDGIEFDEDELIKVILDQSDNLSKGPNNLPYFFIKRIASSIIQPLLCIFQNSLNTAFTFRMKNRLLCRCVKVRCSKLPDTNQLVLSLLFAN